MIRDFSNRKTGKNYFDTNQLPNVDLEKTPMFVTFDIDGYFNSQGDGKNRPPKKYLVKSAGVVDESRSKNMDYAYSVLGPCPYLWRRLELPIP